MQTPQQFTDEFILATEPVQLFRELDKALAGAHSDPDSNWLAWDTESILLTLDRDRTLITENTAIDKIMAVKSAAFNMNVPCTHALAFEKVVLAFCNNECVMDAVQPPFVEEIFYTVYRLKVLAKEVHGKETKLDFRGEIPGYVAATAKHRNVLVLPKPLDFAQDLLTFLTGYAPNSDELSLIEQVHELARENPAGLKDHETLSRLSPIDDKNVVDVLRCYLYYPYLY
jgi:hypothetical protein